mmetsp:Transcript_52290/g.122433  ORF Transcript_52290/g.122433 Transcript_52290/m.122433 type:complete len:231 (-) Transcript_52290:1132-1824(-)
MVPEKTWYSWMCQRIGVANKNLVSWERPMILCASGVMIVNECHCTSGCPSKKAWRFALRILQSPILAFLHSFLQDTFRGKIKSCRRLPCCVHPVQSILPMLILICAQSLIIILHVTPKFTHSPSWFALLAVETYVLGCITLYKVKAPGIKANLQPEPSEPDADSPLHLVIGMINVRCCIELGIIRRWMMLTCAVREKASFRDSPTLPVHNTSEAQRSGLQPSIEDVPSTL